MVQNNQKLEKKGTEIPTLCELCIRTITTSSKYKTIDGLMKIYCTIDIQSPIYEQLYLEVMKKINYIYPMIKEKYKKEEIIEFFHEQDLIVFEKNFAEFVETKKKFESLKGTIVEPIDTGTITPTDDGYYPLNALIQGVSWPKHIDPTKREQYLSPNDFFNVFQMTKDEFLKKDKYLRLRLKKEHQLF